MYGHEFGRGDVLTQSDRVHDDVDAVHCLRETGVLSDVHDRGGQRCSSLGEPRGVCRIAQRSGRLDACGEMSEDGGSGAPGRAENQDASHTGTSEAGVRVSRANPVKLHIVGRTTAVNPEMVTDPRTPDRIASLYSQNGLSFDGAVVLNWPRALVEVRRSIAAGSSLSDVRVRLGRLLESASG